MNVIRLVVALTIGLLELTGARRANAGVQLQSV